MLLHCVTLYSGFISCCLDLLLFYSSTSSFLLTLSFCHFLCHIVLFCLWLFHHVTIFVLVCCGDLGCVWFFCVRMKNNSDTFYVHISNMFLGDFLFTSLIWLIKESMIRWNSIFPHWWFLTDWLFLISILLHHPAMWSFCPIKATFSNHLGVITHQSNQMIHFF